MSTESNASAKTLDLQTVEAQSRDVGRGIARLDPADIEALGAGIGDILEIAGKRRTVAKLMPAFKEFRGRQAVQIDGIIRENAGVGLSEKVVVRVVPPQAATFLQLTPVTAVPRRQGYTAYIGKLIDGLPMIEGDRIRVTFFGSRFQEFKVQRTEPKGVVLIDPTTTFAITDPKFQAAGGVEKQTKIAFEDIGGLRREVERVRELIELPLKHPAIFERLGIEPLRGLLLVGPPGVGKTLVAGVVAQEANTHFITVSGPEILYKFFGDAEARLRQVFEEASRNQPAVIFIDQIEVLAPKREVPAGEVERRLVGQILTLMDGLRDRGQVVVIGATNSPDRLDPSLRRAGRFDQEIRLRVPNIPGREEILEIHSRGMPLGEDVDLRALALMTHGYVGADLHRLCREAAMIALRREISSAGDLDTEFIEDRLPSLYVTMDDFRNALKLIEPSAGREVTVDTPETPWTRLGGLDGIRRDLTRAVLVPLGCPELFVKYGVRPVRGVLLHGPSGVGKTRLARALASAGGLHFITVRSPELLSKYVVDPERTLHDIFSHARQMSPCIIFIDELDFLMPSAPATENGQAGIKDRLLGQLLAELDLLGELKNIIVVAATNRPDRIDPALLRPGRFDIVQEIPLPDRDGIEAILKIYLESFSTPDLDLATLAEMTLGLTGADIEAVCRTAATQSIEALAGSGNSPGTNGGPPKLLVTQAALENAVEVVRRMRGHNWDCPPGRP